MFLFSSLSVPSISSLPSALSEDPTNEDLRLEGADAVADVSDCLVQILMLVNTVLSPKVIRLPIRTPLC